MNLSLSQENFTSHFQDTFGKNPIAAINSLTKTVKSVLSVIAGSESKHGYCWLSQSTIAKYVGCTRQYVTTCIKYLCSLGLITKTWQPWVTCNYKIAEFLKTNGVIVLLKDLIPGLSGFYKKIKLDISLLFSAWKNPSRNGLVCTTNCIDRLDLSKISLSSSSKKDARRTSAGRFLTKNDLAVNRKLMEEVKLVTKRQVVGRNELDEDVRERETGLIALKKAAVGMNGANCYYFNKQKLTLRGRLDLSPFSDEIVREAFKTLNEKYKPSAVKSPLALVFGMCKKRYDELGLTLDYGARNRLYAALGDDKEILPLWEKASVSEIAAHSSKQAGQTRQTDNRGYKKEEKSPQREAWKSHLRADDVEIVTYLTPEQVEANVKVLESNPVHKGIDFRQVFAKELREGETIRTTERESKQKENALSRYSLSVDGNSIERSKGEQGSNTINEKGLGNVNDRQRQQGFASIDPGYALRRVYGLDFGRFDKPG